MSTSVKSRPAVAVHKKRAFEQHAGVLHTFFSKAPALP